MLTGTGAEYIMSIGSDLWNNGRSGRLSGNGISKKKVSVWLLVVPKVFSLIKIVLL